MVPEHIGELEVLVGGHPALDAAHLLQAVAQLQEERGKLLEEGRREEGVPGRGSLVCGIQN